MSEVPSNLIPTRITQLPNAPVASEDGLLLFVYQGNSYKIRAGDLLSVSGVPTTRQVIAGTGLTGGGQLVSNVTLSIAPGGVGTTELTSTGVTPGSYGTSGRVPVFNVDADGRLTSASSVDIVFPYSGTVTSVSGTGTVSGITLSGTVNSSGFLTLGGALTVSPSDFGSQTGNTVLAAPDGGGGNPTFRFLLPTDIPTLNQNTTGQAGSVANALTVGSGLALSSGSTYDGSAARTITNSAPDRVVSLTGAGSTTVTGTYPNFTISSTGGGGGSVNSVTATSPVVSSGGANPNISLASGYGDTQNPYASKTANFVLAAPNGSAGVPTFRAVVAADIPTLNQNTTGTAANVTGVVAPANGGTGVANNAASTLTISGSFGTTVTVTGTTSVTLPTSGTLATLAGTETFTNKTLGSGTLFGANVNGQDNNLLRVELQDFGYVYFNSGTTNALDYVNGSHQRWAPNTGAQTLTISNWPPSGNLGELLIEGVNLGAATITWPTINWITSNGTTTTIFANNGVTLQTSGTDWILLWTRDAGTTIYGKVVR